MSKTTYIHEDDISSIVAICGGEIRSFLDYLIEPQKESPYAAVKEALSCRQKAVKECAAVLADFKKNPHQYTNDQLVRNGADTEKANYFPVRIEVRRTEGIAGASQIAAKGICDDFRQVAVARLKKILSKEGDSFGVRIAGYSSLELNIRGVNKALPIHYLRHQFDDILGRMRYTPGSFINAKQTKTIIAADGDGTLYSGPTDQEMPVLKESVAYNEILNYLKAGGILMLVSGNEMKRTSARVSSFIPEELKTRVIVVANGGADLGIYNKEGILTPLEEYRLFSLSFLSKPAKHELDIIFIGDDERLTGNDLDAFEAIGAEHSYLVSPEEPTEKFMREVNYIGGNERGTKKLLKAIVEKAKANKGKPLFNKRII